VARSYSVISEETSYRIKWLWNIFMTGAGITASVDQSGYSIYRRCKFEGTDPWNSVIAGSLSGNSVNMAIPCFLK
jgi:hypothetical protein